MSGLLISGWSGGWRTPNSVVGGHPTQFFRFVGGWRTPNSGWLEDTQLGGWRTPNSIFQIRLSANYRNALKLAV
jgi:hypothetical protein